MKMEESQRGQSLLEAQVTLGFAVVEAKLPVCVSQRTTLLLQHPLGLVSPAVGPVPQGEHPHAGHRQQMRFVMRVLIMSFSLI